MIERPPRLAILDSGVHLGHPHVGGIAGSISIHADSVSGVYVDRLGHGTAIASLIHYLHPRAELFAVRIFEQRLSTNLATVLRAIDWCIAQQIDIINLSMRTKNEQHRAPFEAAITRASESGAKIVSAFEHNDEQLLPGSLPGFVGVIADPAEGVYRLTHRGEKEVIAASPYPRAIPGVAREHNLPGVSFAIACVSSHLAQAMRPQH